QGLIWFILGGVATASLNSAVIVSLTRRDWSTSTFRIDWAYCRHLVRQALPLGIAAWFAVLCFRIDALMLSSLEGEVAAGLYVAAFKFVETSSVISAVVMSSVFPVFSYAFAHDKGQFSTYYRNSLEVVVALSLSVALFLYLFAGQILLLLAGSAF